MIQIGIEGVCRETLKALGVEYLDLYLIHAPFKSNGDAWATPIDDVWSQMEALVDGKLVKAIGVSNWLVKDLEKIYDKARIKPACNQIEAHPYLQQDDLFKYCSEREIVVTAYAPLASITKVRDGPVGTYNSHLSLSLCVCVCACVQVDARDSLSFLTEV